MIRKAARAGMFYPGEREQLKQMLVKLMPDLAKKQTTETIGIMVPHAGYEYSGRVAGSVYSGIEIPDTVVIIGPNHTGLGSPRAVMTEGAWETPLGVTKIDADLAVQIQKHSKYLEADEDAHSKEHSIEVQLPFIQLINPNAKLVPICLADYSPAVCEDIGKAIALPVSKERDVLIVASSDMTHYEPGATAEQKDKIALERILALDPDGLLETVTINDITMCGSGPVAVMLHACKLLGAKNAQLIRYETSGEATGDYSSVVGYAGVIVKRQGGR